MATSHLRQNYKEPSFFESFFDLQQKVGIVFLVSKCSNAAISSGFLRPTLSHGVDCFIFGILRVNISAAIRIPTFDQTEIVTTANYLKQTWLSICKNSSKHNLLNKLVQLYFVTPMQHVKSVAMYYLKQEVVLTQILSFNLLLLCHKKYWIVLMSTYALHNHVICGLWQFYTNIFAPLVYF